LSIVSFSFLVLFLPISIGLYYITPKKNNLLFRNIILFFVSLVFYILEEPIFVFLLLGMIFLTWCFGKMAFEKKGTRTGKLAIALTIVANLFVVVIIFNKTEIIISIINQLFGRNFPEIKFDFPIGFSFFIFSSISYVVDIYRGQCKSNGTILETALYTSVFFKILQGPIISYRKFENQMSDRKESMELFSKGIWRLSVGLCKKVIIADMLYPLVHNMLSLDFSAIPLGDAWFICITYLVYLYFDFSGYSDMAIGLGKIFGFSIPENFNYPYISKSISEFWRRFHITLCVWFTEYLYYPILLGPSVRLRKFLQKRSVSSKAAKSVQNIFVLASVWLVTALWHGMNLNYAVWGLINCVGMLIEPHIKTFKNKRFNSAIRHAGMLLFLVVSMPLISINSFNDALLFYKALFFGALKMSDTIMFLAKNYGLILTIAILGCFPIVPAIKNKFIGLTNVKRRRIWDISSSIIMMALVLVSLGFIISRGTITFLYQQ